MYKNYNQKSVNSYPSGMFLLAFIGEESSIEKLSGHLTYWIKEEKYKHSEVKCPEYIFSLKITLYGQVKNMFLLYGLTHNIFSLTDQRLTLYILPDESIFMHCQHFLIIVKSIILWYDYLESRSEHCLVVFSIAPLRKS